jgi:hypothetical protein
MTNMVQSAPLLLLQRYQSTIVETSSFLSRALDTFHLFGVHGVLLTSTHESLRITGISHFSLIILFPLVKHVACYSHSFRISVSSLGRKVGLASWAVLAHIVAALLCIYFLGGVQNREYKFRVSSYWKRIDRRRTLFTF